MWGILTTGTESQWQNVLFHVKLIVENIEKEVFVLGKKSILTEKFQESVTSVFPITLIVLLLCFTVAPISNSMLVAFLIGAVLLVAGMAFFTVGADTAMTPIGNKVGSYITKSKKVWLIVFVSFLLGVIITVSEPDLQVLANQVPTIPNGVLILAVALGVGISSIRSDRHAGDDSFGLVALCSIGPILAVLVLGLLYPAEGVCSGAYRGILCSVSGLCHQNESPLIRICLGLVFTYVGLVMFLTGVNVGFMPLGFGSQSRPKNIETKKHRKLDQ